MGDELNNLVSCISALPAVELREQNFFCFCFYQITWRVEVFSVQFKEEWCLLHLFPIHRRSPPVTLWKLIKWNVNLNNHVGSILVTFATLTHKCNSKCASVFVRWLWNPMTRIGSPVNSLLTDWPDAAFLLIMSVTELFTVVQLLCPACIITVILDIISTSQPCFSLCFRS